MNQAAMRPGWRLGGLIAGIFGLVFVLANATTPLGTAADTALRGLAVLAFVVLLVVQRRAPTGASRDRNDDTPQLFGPRYWRVVTLEVLAGVAGLVALRALDAPQPANVAWIAIVVGIHFVGFVHFDIWHPAIPGAEWALVVYGAAGLVLATNGAVDWVLFVSGVLSGYTLLATSLMTAARHLPTRPTDVVSR